MPVMIQHMADITFLTKLVVGITPWERTAGFASLFLIDIDTIYMVL